MDESDEILYKKPTRLSILREIPWGRVMIFVTVPYALLCLWSFIRTELISPDRQNRYQLKNFIPAWQWRTWAILFLVISILATWEGVLRAIRRRHKLAERLLQKVADLEQQIGNKIPRLMIYSNDTLVIPGPEGSIEIFIDAEVVNGCALTSTIADGYSVSIERNGKKYESNVPLKDVAEYQVFNVSEVPDDDRRRLIEVADGHERLMDLAQSINYQFPVVYSVPRKGWLHFRINNTPPWAAIEVDTGESDWQPQFVEEDDDSHQTGDLVPGTRTVYTAQEVTGLTISIATPGQGYTGTFFGSIDHSGRRKISRIHEG